MLPVLALSTSGLFATNPIPANDRKDITKARAAVGKNGLLLKWFSKYVRNDYETCVVAIKNNPVAYTYAGDVVKNGPDAARLMDHMIESFERFSGELTTKQVNATFESVPLSLRTSGTPTRGRWEAGKNSVLAQIYARKSCPECRPVYDRMRK